MCLALKVAKVTVFNHAVIWCRLFRPFFLLNPIFFWLAGWLGKLSVKLEYVSLTFIMKVLYKHMRNGRQLEANHYSSLSISVDIALMYFFHDSATTMAML